MLLQRWKNIFELLIIVSLDYSVHVMIKTILNWLCIKIL